VRPTTVTIAMGMGTLLRLVIGRSDRAPWAAKRKRRLKG
jgi:hypothetical protein